MNLTQILDKNVRRTPHFPAVTSETETFTWQEFCNQVNQLGNALQKLGVQKGDRIAIYLPNSPEYLVTYFAAARIGAIAVPLTSCLKAMRSFTS